MAFMLIQHGNKLSSLSYFIDAPARLAGAVAGFVDEVSRFADTARRRPDHGHRRWDKHDVFTDDGVR